MVYVKLFESILASTIWAQSHPTRIVWITMLAMADRNGTVAASLPGLAHIARVSESECRAAIEALSAPDPESRTPACEGRRIAKVDGGWEIINYGLYRDKASAEHRREQDRVRQQRRRERHGMSRLSRSVTPSEAEAEADAEGPAGSSPESTRTSSSSSPPVPQQEKDGSPASSGKDQAGPRDRAGPSTGTIALLDGEVTEAALYAALKKTRYRDNARSREHDLMLAAKRLEDQGFSVADIWRLQRKARTRKGATKPEGLFASWIDNTDEALKELSKR